MTTKGRRLIVAIAALALTTALAASASLAGGAGPGAKQQKPRIDPNEDITLVAWHREGTGPGTGGEVLEKLAAQFKKRYPNVTVKFVFRPYATYITTVKLALSSRSAPDIVEGQPGYQLDATLIKARLVRPLDDYAKAFGWLKRYPASFVRMNSFTRDGKFWGRGSFWGGGLTGEMGGWYYNKEKLQRLGLRLPRTLAEFEQALAKAKAAGETPIMLGNNGGWEATHLLNTIVNQMASPSLLNGIAYGDRKARWDSAPVIRAAAKLREWVQKGYVPEGFGTFPQGDALARFTAGEGVFMQCGSWCTGPIEKGLGAKAGYFLPPPLTAGQPSRATGATAAAASWRISTKTKHADAAAVFIDWITTDAASREFAGVGYLPGVGIKNPPYKAGTVSAAVYQAWRTVHKTNGIVMYLELSTPTTPPVYYAALQEILAGKLPPKEAFARVQEEREKFYTKQGIWGP